MTNNYFDYRFVTTIPSRQAPSFMNIIKTKKNFTGRLLSKDSLSSVNNIINSAQKIVNIYDQAIPIINQAKPMINNIRTTFKVAKAFKKMSGEESLEKAFDNLPDYKEENTNINTDLKNNFKDNHVDNGMNPFYPK